MQWNTPSADVIQAQSGQNHHGEDKNNMKYVQKLGSFLLSEDAY